VVCTGRVQSKAIESLSLGNHYRRTAGIGSEKTGATLAGSNTGCRVETHPRVFKGNGPFFVRL